MRLSLAPGLHGREVACGTVIGWSETSGRNLFAWEAFEKSCFGRVKLCNLRLLVIVSIAAHLGGCVTAASYA